MSTTYRESLATVLYQDKVTPVARALTADQELWLTLGDLTASTEWELNPEGVCREEICIPIPEGRDSRFLQNHQGQQWLNLTELASLLGQPSAHDPSHNVWSFGPALDEWRTRLTLALAPDFTLPDLEGNLHSLTHFRGKKVLLACWASW